MGKGTGARVVNFYLRETFLLQVCDDALTHEVAGLDDIKNFVVLVLHERKFEAILSGINVDGARAGAPVKAVNGLAFDPGQVDRLFEGLNDTVVAVTARTSEYTEFCIVIEGTNPWKRAYLIWLRVEYTKTPLSSQAPDLIRIVSWIRQLCPRVLFAIVIAEGFENKPAAQDTVIYLLCLLRRATIDASEFQIAYFTGGVLSSATTFPCWMSKRTTEVGELTSKLAVPP